MLTDAERRGHSADALLGAELLLELHLWRVTGGRAVHKVANLCKLMVLTYALLLFLGCLPHELPWLLLIVGLAALVWPAVLRDENAGETLALLA